MSNALLLSPAYGWFIGLLVVMIVVTGLFALILFIALRPVKKDVAIEDVSYAKALLGRREAELTMEIMNNKGNVEVMDSLMAKLREVAAAEKLIDELADGGDTPSASSAPKAAAKPQPAPKAAGAAKTPNAAAAQNAPRPAVRRPAAPVNPSKAAQAPESAKDAENK